VTRPRRGLGAAFCLITALLVLSACGSGSDPATPTTAPTRLPTPTPAPHTPQPTSSTGFPREQAHPDPNYDEGFWIQITATGFKPAWLVAPCCQAITWKNLTNMPVTVVFDHVAGGSQMPIPPGGTYIFTPSSVVSITYHSGTNPAFKGRISVNQLAE
jgi:hypothetical protein